MTLKQERFPQKKKIPENYLGSSKATEKENNSLIHS